ncbi:group II intron maturase-specific domain-containing protein [Roseateles cellulosilyticus]|uniref:Group II intron maturase-specific domain-containing protein n=1 Tax=Pelomonas cellulosilytica TaxID=2906762 RepID=A0ABS8XTV7_9BURK|nr:group II intron maturase-specific domain-containing protein [Pelomonas sp. P8]MCE4556136.1 hypothetical protein [Pelomonas sp. P8]
MNRVRERVRGLTQRGPCHKDLHDVIGALNPVLRGWGNHFRTGNAANHFIDVDDYVAKRLRSLRLKRAGRSLKAGQAKQWNRDFFESLGLYRLRGDNPLSQQGSCSQEACVMLRADRPPVSRVREIRMHGLRGGVGFVLDLRARNRANIYQ